MSDSAPPQYLGEVLIPTLVTLALAIATPIVTYAIWGNTLLSSVTLVAAIPLAFRVGAQVQNLHFARLLRKHPLGSGYWTGR